MRMPTRARARGMPTAQPTITPMFDLDLPPDCEELAAVAVGSAVGVMTEVLYTVLTPPASEVRLVSTDVNGAAEVPSAVAEREPAVEPPFDPDVSEGELPLPVPLAKPVIDEIVGTLDAWLAPMVAYACPSWSAKNGRGAGDSLQQFTCWASALQHQSLL